MKPTSISKRKNHIQELILKIGEVFNWMNKFYFCLVVCTKKHKYWTLIYGIILQVIRVQSQQNKK